ncbi:MAG TPA: acetyl-CoA carboxylase, carboxyltransferase subunit beta [Oligoflexia bacterium]|nr:acetyl-CoA carboxylase, carboxyltransferase subunit beta [Oligoflexia bacterium]HMR24898.1 acetyl-CoA carboxylase, carboxyltransferase subunit beta [Oligoflexia bacterium]
MSWLNKFKAPRISNQTKKREDVPEGLWEKCPSCQEILFAQDLAKNLMVCSNCQHHFKLSARQRIDCIVDPGSFDEVDHNLKPTDPLQFKDSKKYSDRIKAMAKSLPNENEAYIYGKAQIKGKDFILGSFVFEYMGGSMGSVVGEKLTRTYELALKEKKPVVVITASGGARMQEGILSLMQMAKCSAAIKKLKKAGIPYIVLLTHPTTGGVAASMAMLGDVHLAEPNALIGFAGPRVIEQTIKQTLPAGFQRSEFLLEHGMVDRIVHRKDLRTSLEFFISNLGYKLYVQKPNMKVVAQEK